MIKEFQEILQEFSKLPKLKKQLTYLELCRYPYRRFEEICSRLLCFYFDPNQEHSFKDLFLSSLFQLLRNHGNFEFDSDIVKIENEVDYQSYSLDILIETSSTVIGIENKINASLYNDLSIYANLIRHRAEEKGLQTVNIVLSLNKIWKPHELQKLQDNNFINILYKELFTAVLGNIGSYMRFCDPKQLLFLNDFIQTIENMTNTTIISPEFDEFYYKNSSSINEFNDQCESFFTRLFALHRQRMKELLEPVKANTSNPNWKIWDTWEDGIYLYEKTTEETIPEIGVECVFSDAKGNPYDKLEIYISTWNTNDWAKYASFIRDEINIPETVSDNKTYILYKTITSNQDKEIIETLCEAYMIKQRIVEKYKKQINQPTLI